MHADTTARPRPATRLPRLLLALSLGFAAFVGGRALADACACPDCSCGASCPCSTH